MFCYQCEQTNRSGETPGCSAAVGTCGKDETTAALQDLLIYQLKGIGQYARRARALGTADDEVAAFLAFAMFTTLTNVNFTATRFVSLIDEAAALRDRVRTAYLRAAEPTDAEPTDEVWHPAGGPAAFVPATDTDALTRQATALGILAGLEDVGADVVGLRALNLYGLKGICAYIHHANVLGFRDQHIFAAVENALDFLAGEPTDVEDLLEHALGLGTTNLAVMAMLHEANTANFGTPAPATVRTTPIAGKAILVSGHDFPGLLALLEQTRGTGINVYTHGEMLPAHSYPILRAYEHLAGNYGGAWQDQQTDFANFPGPIVMTSNCIIEPRPAYRQRIFTNGPAGWPGVRHLATHDFAQVIKAAQAMPGFKTTEPEQTGLEQTEPERTEPERTITVGFGHDAVLGVADTVIDAVRTGQIRRFFLIGGCDGAAPGREYYTDLATSTPQDTMVMTLGCAKYRFNNHDFGQVAGLPRLLDLGQCNDAYSAIQIATVLAGAFDCDVDDLPLSLVLSWFEQKAVAVLLTLLALGIRNISLGPTLPAFLTPTAAAIVVERFGLRGTTTPEQDLALVLG